MIDCKLVGVNWVNCITYIGSVKFEFNYTSLHLKNDSEYTRFVYFITKFILCIYDMFFDIAIKVINFTIRNKIG